MFSFFFCLDTFISPFFFVRIYQGLGCLSLLGVDSSWLRHWGARSRRALSIAFPCSLWVTNCVLEQGHDPSGFPAGCLHRGPLEQKDLRGSREEVTAANTPGQRPKPLSVPPPQGSRRLSGGAGISPSQLLLQGVSVCFWGGGLQTLLPTCPFLKPLSGLGWGTFAAHPPESGQALGTAVEIRY